jgi:acyl-CoA reductase-like NAD-dependent aldehyde dehydrogenase
MFSTQTSVKDLKVVPFLINGIYYSATSNAFPVYSNKLQQELCQAQSADTATATFAADIAAKAFKTWKQHHGRLAEMYKYFFGQ